MAANKVGRPPSAETLKIREALALKARVDKALGVTGTTTLTPKARYDAAGNGRRLAGWNPPSQGPNAATSGLQTIRNRARDVTSNDWSGESIIQKWTTSLVGVGVTPRFKRISDKTRKQQIVDLWNDFCAQADADGVLNMYAMQTLVVRSWLDSGEVFARRRPRFLDEGYPVPLQVQLIEAEMVPLYDSDARVGLPVGNIIRSGIEFNKRGRRVAYWVCKTHPGDVATFNVGDDDLVRVLASEITHIFEPKRPGQIRGVSMLAPVLNRLRTIENYDDAVLTRQQIANLFVGLITRGLPEVGDDDDVDTLTGRSIESEGASGALLGLQPGLMQELDDGQDIKFSSPPDAGTNYSDYMRTQHLGTSAAGGMPYELFSGDIKEISDRTLRVVIMEFRRFAEQRQWQIVIPMFCQPVIDWFAQAAVIAGLIREDEYDSVRRVEHAPHGWSHIHPVQDPQGKKLEVEANFRSRSSVIGERGDDADMVDDEIQADDQRQQDLHIGPYSEANKLAMSTLTTPDDGSADDDDTQTPEKKVTSALDLALIARAQAESRALDAQAKRALETPVVDPDAASRLALQQSIVKALEPVGGSE